MKILDGYIKLLSNSGNRAIGILKVNKCKEDFVSYAQKISPPTNGQQKSYLYTIPRLSKTTLTFR